MSNATSRLGVVTVTYNSSSVLDDFLRSTLAQTLTDFRLYVIDNSSGDDTVSRLQPLQDPRVLVICNQDNLGVAEGNNQGIRRALEDGCSHVLLLNNDTVFGPEMFQKLLESSVREDHSVVVPKMYFHDRPQMLWFAGGHFLPARGYSTRHVGEGLEDEGQFDQHGRTQYAPTCCMLIAAPVFDLVGLMDPAYFVYYDDTDFCFRLARAGIPIWYDPSITLHHKVSSLTGGTQSPFSARMGARNKIYFLRKHFGPVRTAWVFPAYVCYVCIRWIGGKDSGKIFRIKLKALAEGLKL